MKTWTWGLALALCAASLLNCRSAAAQDILFGGQAKPASSGYYRQQMPAENSGPGYDSYPADYGAEEGYGAEQGYGPNTSYGGAPCSDGNCGAGSCGPGGCGPAGCGDAHCQGGTSCRSGRCRVRKSPLECDAENVWHLFSHMNECSNISITGWVNGGVTLNGDPPASGFNGVTTFNDRDREGQLNQAYLTLEKAIDTSECSWDIGGRVDLLYGTDSRFTEARGLEKYRDLSPHWNGEPYYGLALPQLYLEAGCEDLSVKVGHFYTIIGYESVMATSNFFYSHAYTMQYGEPFTHTGALATYKACDELSFLAGFDRGWDNWEDDDTNRIGGLGGVTYADDCGLSLALTGTAGNEPTATGTEPNPVTAPRYMYSFVASKELNTRWTYVVQHDWGWQDRAVANNTQDAEWYGINQYLFYKLNCCWTAGARFEWFRDDDGFRVAGIGSRTTPNPLGDTRFIGNFYEVTLGLNWKPTDNFCVRPEFRYDWFSGQTTNANVGPFDDGASTDQSLFAIDAYLTY